MAMTNESAVRRLQRDVAEWRENAKHFSNMGASPLEEDIMNWHFNMVVGDVALHGQIRFPESYPFDPPRVSFFGDVPHRQVEFKRAHGLGYVCLDMLEHTTSGHYQGWSSAYSVVSVMAQMETLLHRLGKNQLPSSWRNFSCGRCGHCGSDVEEFYPRLPPTRSLVAGEKKEKFDKKSSSSSSSSSCHVSEWRKLNRDVEGVIFSFLSQSDFGYLVFVNVHLRQALHGSRVYHKRMVTCFHSHEHFGDFVDAKRGTGDVASVRGKLFGMGFGVEYWENEDGRTGVVTRKMKDLNMVPDVLSFGAFCQGVRFSMWREERFEEFLPLYLNNEHGRIALDLAEKVIGKVYGDEGASGSHAVSFEPVMALKFLSKLMNTTVVRLMKEVEENESCSIALFSSIKALQSYMYCYHLLMGFASRYPSIVEHARRKVNEFVFAGHRRDKKHFPDMGELLIYLTIVPMSWSVFGPVMVEEGLCRNAKWILESCPWLIQTDKNIHVSCVRLRQSFEATVVSKRLVMFQFYFLERVCGVGKLGVQFDLEEKLKEMNACLGQVGEGVAVGLQRRCREIFQVDDWLPFFKLIQLPCPSARRLSHDLREAMLESERKGYQRFSKIDIDLEDEAHAAHEDTDLCLCSGQIMSLQSRGNQSSSKAVAESEKVEETHPKTPSRRRSLDVAFCVDCTGSMSSYLESVKVHIGAIARKLNEEENVNVQFAMVGYRDHNGEAGSWAPNVTKVADFSNLDKFSRNLGQFAVGGGGGVEAVADGWHDILGLKWRRMSVKAVIQVADIGCHGLTRDHDVCPRGYDPIVLAREMLERDMTLYNVGCTMRGWDSEQFFRGTAHMTGGLYLTLGNAEKLPEVILESTKEGLSLTRVIPQVFELMSKFRCQNGSATRDQIGYLVWRELVGRGVETKKVSCVQVDGNGVPDCVVEISNAKTLVEVRRILTDFGRNGRRTSGEEKSGNEERGSTNGRLITLEQTMRCMNRAEQMGNRLKWMKHGCVYRMRKYLREASEKRFVEYGVEYRGKMRRIRRHKFENGTMVEFTDFKSKRVYSGKVVGRDESKFSMTVHVNGLRGNRTVALTSRNVSKSGTLLKKRFGRDGMVDPHFKEMEAWWAKEMEKKRGKNMEREERKELEEKDEEKTLEEAPTAHVEERERRQVAINAWATQTKTIAAVLAEPTGNEKTSTRPESVEEEEQVWRGGSGSVAETARGEVMFAPCELSGKEMVVRSMLCVVPPRKIQRGIDSIRGKLDPAGCRRWMANVPLLFPFVPESMFDGQGVNLEEVFGCSGIMGFELEMFGFGLVDGQVTDRDSDPVVCVCLEMRVVETGNGTNRRNGWRELVDCVCKMYPNASDGLRRMTPHVVVGRVPRSEARQVVRELEKEWMDRRLLPVRFWVDGLSMLCRQGNGLAARFEVGRVVPFGRMPW